MPYRVIVFSFLGILIFGCSVKQEAIKSRINYSRDSFHYKVYKNYCFEKIDSCINLVHIQNISKGFVTKPDSIIENIQIKSLSPNKLSDQTIISQFLLSLECYNYIYNYRPPKVMLDMRFFFQNANFKNSYFQEINAEHWIKILNLKDYKYFDFKYQVTHKKLEDGNIEVTFGSNNKVKVICSKKFFDEVFFNQYINFLAVDHKVTPFQITIIPK